MLPHSIHRTDEMRPEWFSLPSSNIIDNVEGKSPSIPFSQMWETDHIWLPLLINKQKFVGRADFTKDGEKLAPYRWWFAIAPNDP